MYTIRRVSACANTDDTIITFCPFAFVCLVLFFGGKNTWHEIYPLDNSERMILYGLPWTSCCTVDI